MSTRLIGAAAILLGLMGFSTMVAAPAGAATVICPPMSSAVCKSITPVAECVWSNNDGTSTALWGWVNPTSDTASIPIGSKNRMSPGSNDQGQPVLLGPGTNRNVFTTTFSGSSGSWRLGNATVTADGKSPRCATKPVPQVGNVGALLVAIAVLAMGALLAIAARPRTRLVTP